MKNSKHNIIKNDVERRAIRHGEILLLPVGALPEGYEEQPAVERYVVGHSETGHHHVLVADAPTITPYLPKGADSGDIYVRVGGPNTRLEHLKAFDRHETKDVFEGLYRRVGKTEYDPFSKLIQQVRD